MIENLGLSVRLVVRAAVIRRGEDLVVEATFTNTTAAPLVVNTWVLNFASLVLDLERVDGPDGASATPVPLGAPPTPPAADDTSGQVSFAPGESVTFVYEGRKFLGGQTLPDAAYRLRLVYDNPESPPGEWRGSLETDWLRFQVDSKRRR
jgi:hypothetical protein